MTGAATFGIVGGAGFRAQYFLRIAQALPERFRVAGLVVRDADRGAEMERRWDVPTFRTLDDFLARTRPNAPDFPDFVVVSVPAAAGAGYIRDLAGRGVPVLAETPPAPDLDGLHRLWADLAGTGARVQVAEQYHLHPVNQARLALVEEGRLGPVTQATVSFSHLYHAVSLLRLLLGVGYDDAVIRGMRFESPWVAGPTREGPPREDVLVTSERDLAWLDFGDRLGCYDFTANQHRSWIRSNHVSVRGHRGEIFDRRVRVQEPSGTPLDLELTRVNRGEWENAEGYFLQGITAGDRWVYQNPFAPARLYDDEIAIATCLAKMAEHAAGGPGFYGLDEACQDHYLGMMIAQAVRTGETVRTERQPWAPAAGG
ncbi:Oxidoreductase family, NAD-binding Rossmann fold [Actinopolymorpha cephalotaxi]|uniref:Dehydrogenase n=1 Tax=Actinopolymorpha cephalotaxi TaxID=504797 RepID=A0A1I2LP59_9ACTN|nr:Gfo/Idh/MocA family oxidoreductase [Actinopolymorpha cephalotaxi]NYH81396.1 putative dehydrogenase [Actinopolymorpha cephalotaxi]SFF81312.1 Oxidoreductase family, NAD-binding Rossmann fold [Actinopolymorpha cephalotaxi]